MSEPARWARFKPVHSEPIMLSRAYWQQLPFEERMVRKYRYWRDRVKNPAHDDLAAYNRDVYWRVVSDLLHPTGPKIRLTRG